MCFPYNQLPFPCPHLLDSLFQFIYIKYLLYFYKLPTLFEPASISRNFAEKPLLKPIQQTASPKQGRIYILLKLIK